MRGKALIILAVMCILFVGCGEKTDTIKLRKESEHFKYSSTKSDKEALDDLEENLESNYDRIAKNLNVTLDEKIDITIYPNIDEFHKAIGMEDAEDWLVGVAGTSEVAMVSPLNPGPIHTYDSLMSVIVHEYTHILVMNLNADTDTYLNEGIAVVEVNQLDKLPSIDEMKNNYSGLEQPYFLSGGFVDFIINNYGYDGIINLIKNPDDLERITGSTKEELEQSWKEYIVSTY